VKSLILIKQVTIVGTTLLAVGLAVVLTRPNDWLCRSILAKPTCQSGTKEKLSDVAVTSELNQANQSKSGILAQQLLDLSDSKVPSEPDQLTAQDQAQLLTDLQTAITQLPSSVQTLETGEDKTILIHLETNQQLVLDQNQTELVSQLRRAKLILSEFDFEQTPQPIVEIDVRYQLPVMRITKTVFPESSADSSPNP